MELAPTMALWGCPMATPRGPEDGGQVGQFYAEAFGGDHVMEEFPVKRSPGMDSIFRKPALFVRYYEGDVVTLSEGEWIERTTT